MVDSKSGKPLSIEDQQAQYIAMLEEECSANRLVKRQMKEMYESQIENLSRELDAFRTEYLNVRTQPIQRSPSPSMASSSTVSALQMRVQELEEELARRDELANGYSSSEDDEGDERKNKCDHCGAEDGVKGTTRAKDSAIVLEDAQRKLEAAVAALEAERRQHALDCAQAAKHEAELRRTAWKARSRELAALARMRTQAIKIDEEKEQKTGSESDSDEMKALREENKALKQELSVVYARMDKLAQMFLSRLNSVTVSSSPAITVSPAETTKNDDENETTETKNVGNDVEELRKLLLSGEEERRQVRLSLETARRDVETVVSAIRTVTTNLEQLRVKIIGSAAANSGIVPAGSSKKDEKSDTNSETNLTQMVLGVHGELDASVTRFNVLMEQLEKEVTQIATPFSIAETVALLKQEKTRLEADMEDMTNKCERSDHERVFAAQTLMQFFDAEEKDKKAIFMQLAEVLRLSMQDRERALTKFGAIPTSRSFLSRLKMGP